MVHNRRASRVGPIIFQLMLLGVLGVTRARVQSLPPPQRELALIARFAGTGGEFAQFSADGKLLLTAFGGYARVWDVGARKPSTRLLAHDAQIEAVAFLQDGSEFAVATQKEIVIRDSRTAAIVGTPLAFHALLHPMTISPDGELVAGFLRSSRWWWNGKVLVYSIATGKALYQFETEPVAFLRFNVGHKALLAMTGDGIHSEGTEYKLWRMSDGHAVGELMPTNYSHRLALDSANTPAAFSSDGKKVAFAEQQSFYICDADSGQFLAASEPLQNNGSSVYYVAFVDHDRAIATNQVFAAAPNVAGIRWLAAPERFNNLCFSADGKFCVGDTSEDSPVRRSMIYKIAVFTTADGKMQMSHTLKTAADVISISPDGRIIATCDGDSNDTLLWQLQ